MDNAKKKQIKRYISWACIAVLILMLALMPLIAAESKEANGPEVSILSGHAETGSIDMALHGGGTLNIQDSVNVTIPTDVMLTEFLVDNGDSVIEGQPLASVDRISVMSAITQVQESMDYLVEEMADLKEESGSESIAAQAGGRVKKIYAAAGEDVQDVMLRDGALAILSLDGLMAVSIERNTDLTTGDTVCLTLSDNREVPGRVESNLGGNIVVTVEDEGYPIGEQVTVTTEDGSRIGSGELYVHNAWKATAYFGTVSRVHCKEETAVTAGKTLFTLTDTEYSAQLESLINQHHKYEALLTQLFRMYQDRAISAPCDGVVSGIDKDSIHLLSAGSDSWMLQFLANAPGIDPNLTYTNYVGQITNILGSNWEVRMNPTAQAVTDYTEDLANVSVSTAGMTVSGSQMPVTVYMLKDGEWEIASASVGDILLFAWGSNGCVWAIYVSHEEISTEPEPTYPPAIEPTQPSDPTEPEDPSTSTGPTIADGQEHSGSGHSPSAGSFSGLTGITGSMIGGTAGQPEKFQLYDAEGSTLMSISSGESICLTIELDEKDIGNIHAGMTADVHIDALKGKEFRGQVTEVGATGTNNGGSSKFTVELTVPRDSQMLTGMTATVTIPLYTQENVVLIPVAALVETEDHTIVYTELTEKGELSAPVIVTTGISDGTRVQILSGLNSGDAYCYAYYDTLELSTDVEQSRSPFG